MYLFNMIKSKVPRDGMDGVIRIHFKPFKINLGFNRQKFTRLNIV